MRRAPSFPRSPRVRPFWRSRTQELVDMANSGLQVSSTGLVVSDQGLVVTDVSTGDACCCGATGATCGICSGSTPATWALTFGSVALSTACFHVTGDPGSAKITSGTTFSGTFTVTQNGSFPCQWEYDAPYSGVVAEWWSASTTCGGASTYTSDRINVVMTAAFGGVLSFFVYLYYSGQPAAIVQANLFNGSTSGFDCCANYTGVANGLTAYAGHGELVFDLGKDGTVDATPSC
jgi:hypothetical protein